MSALRAGTWLGDAAEVIDALGVVSDDEAGRVAALLGLELVAGPVTPPTPGVDGTVGPDAVRPPRPAAATAGASGGDRLRSFSLLTLPSLEPVDVQPVPDLPVEPDTPVLDEEKPGVTPPALPFRPLLRPRTAASVVAAVVRTWGPGTRIDERRTVAELARGRPLQKFPRRPRLSLYRGVQLLVDLGEAMEPYGRDQQHVVDLVGRVVGGEATAVGNFENCPSRGTWMFRQAAGVRGRPVLVLTDLGLGGPEVQPMRASAAEWCRYAVGMARAESPVIALVPYSVDPAHRMVSRRIAVVPWDRASVSAAQRARRRAS